jgi:hypothetical protein
MPTIHDYVDQGLDAVTPRHVQTGAASNQVLMDVLGASGVAIAGLVAGLVAGYVFGADRARRAAKAEDLAAVRRIAALMDARLVAPQYLADQSTFDHMSIGDYRKELGNRYYWVVGNAMSELDGLASDLKNGRRPFLGRK